MSQRTYSLLIALIGIVCGYVIVRHVFFMGNAALVRNDLIQGFFVGFGLAMVAIEIYARIKTVRVNGWTTMYGCGEPGNGMLMQAACARVFTGPVNTPEEAMYWKTDVDGAGQTLSGEHGYRMHFPPGGLPPNKAFWSLTMANSKEQFVANPINRYTVGNRSGLAPNADGSLDIYIQNAAPPGRESNWLPAPPDRFRLWLRAYIPGEAILNGSYAVPPVEKVT